MSIRNISPLTFPDSYTGDLDFTVSSKTFYASEFEIVGAPNRKIEIELPLHNTALSNNNGSIPVKNWEASLPLLVSLGPLGSVTLKLGATRSLIPLGFSSGRYTGIHRVRVRYADQKIWSESFGEHRLQLIRHLKVTNRTDLVFSDCYQGDASETIAPTDMTKAAQFIIEGEPEQQVLLRTPPPKTIYMKKVGSSGNSVNPIEISRFSSNPDGYLRLDYFGRALISVGASRNRIPVDQPSGLYKATFTLQVTYL